MDNTQICISFFGFVQTVHAICRGQKLLLPLQMEDLHPDTLRLSTAGQASPINGSSNFGYQQTRVSAGRNTKSVTFSKAAAFSVTVRTTLTNKISGK